MRRVRILSLLAILTINLLVALPALAQTPIVLDGRFGDWQGKAHLDDPVDAHHVAYDISALYWANNIDESRIFFMTERHPPGNPQMQRREVYYALYVDTNNNGKFGDAVDRAVFVAYEPYHPGQNGEVEVVVMNGDKPIVVRTGMWGEHSDIGGRKSEWYVEFSELGINKGQIIRMVLFSTDKQRFAYEGQKFPPTFAECEEYVAKRWMDRLPNSGDIQWAPIPTSTWWLNAVMVGFAAVCYAALQRRKAMTQHRVTRQ